MPAGGFGQRIIACGFQRTGTVEVGILGNKQLRPVWQCCDLAQGDGCTGFPAIDPAIDADAAANGSGIVDDVACADQLQRCVAPKGACPARIARTRPGIAPSSCARELSGYASCRGDAASPPMSRSFRRPPARTVLAAGRKSPHSETICLEIRNFSPRNIFAVEREFPRNCDQRVAQLQMQVMPRALN